MLQYLYSEPSVDLRLPFVVLPHDAKLQDTFRDLDNLEGLLIRRVSSQESRQAVLELIARLKGL